MSHTVTRDRSSTRRDTSERAIAAWMIFTSILNMPPDNFTVPTCSILGKNLCNVFFHHILCLLVRLYIVSMRGVKVNVVLYRCITKIKIEILPCGKAHCRPSAVSEGRPSGFLICRYAIGPRHRDGLPAVNGCRRPWLFLLSRAGWNSAGSKNDIAPRHLDLASLGNRVPRRWVWCSRPNPIMFRQAVAGGTASAGPRPPQVARKR